MTDMRAAQRVGRWRIVLWLAVMALAAWVVAHSRFSTDMSVFLPSQPTARQQILVDQIKDGTLSRLILIGIDGGTAEHRADASRQLAQWLRSNPGFDGAINADAESRDKVVAWLMAHRYALSDQVTPARFGDEGLPQAIAEGASQLASPQGLALKSLFTRDPTGEMLHVLSSLSSGSPPHTEAGVLASADGKRALLMTLSDVAGTDTDALESLLGDIRQEFQRIAQGQPLGLQMTGSPVFSVEARATIKQEVERLSIIGLTGVVVLLLWAYGSPFTLLVGLIPVLSGVLVATATVGVGFSVVHALTIGFGTTLIGEAIDYSIYYLVQGQESRDWTRNFWPAIRLGVATSVCGFAALLFSSFPGLAQLGAYSLAGLIAAALVTRFVLPAFRTRPISLHRVLRLGQWLDGVQARLGGLRIPVAVLVLAAIGLLVWNPHPMWSTQLSDLNPAPRELQALDQHMREEVGAPQLDHLIAIHAPTQEQALQAAEAVLATLQPLVDSGAIDHVDSPSRVLPSQAVQQARLQALPSQQVAQARIDHAADQLPVNTAALAPFVADVDQARQQGPLTLQDLQGTSFAFAFQALTLQRDDHWLVLLPVRGPTSGLPPATQADIAQRLEKLLPAGTAAAAPTVTAQYIDLQHETNHMFGGYLDQAWKLASAGVGAILVLLAISLRSVRRVLRVFTPLASAVVLVMAGQVLAGTPLTLLHLVGMLLIVAVGSNYALFFEQNIDTPARTTGDQARHLALASLLLANMTTVMGFGILAASQFPILHALGIMVGPGAVLALLLSMVWIRPARPTA